MSETLDDDLRAMDGLDALDADETLAAAGNVQRNVNLAQAELLKIACHWADLNAVLDTPAGGRALPGAERLVQLGGDGTPEIAEFAPAELGAQLQMSHGGCSMLIADALDLRHRLPRLWRLLCDGDLKPWIGRQVAQRTRRLGQAGAARVDAKASGYAATMPWARLSSLVEAAILLADPRLAEANAEAERTRQGVFVGRSAESGYKTAFIRAQGPDIDSFDVSIDQIAAALKQLGDADTVDIRRAKAVGIMASPQATLELFDLAADGARVEAIEDVDAQRPPSRRRTIGSAVMYVHLSQQAVTGAPEVARVEDTGPMLLQQVRELVQHRNVTVKPVIDLNDMPAADAYEVPDWLGEAAHLRTPADCSPYSSNTMRRSGDLDHTDRYVPPDDGGPPGQTRLSNLGRLTRTPHRVKTHGRWKVIQLISGSWLWRSPHGYSYLVDGTGTTALGRI